MKTSFHKSLSLLLAVALMTVITGCTTGGGGLTASGGALPGVGPSLSADFGKTEAEIQAAAKNLPPIDVVVPVFDPNLPEDSDTWEKLGVYPELRRAEANRFALKMKGALEDTDVFGGVEVVPNTQVVGDLYVIGKILKSNGEDVHIHITATDISGKKWFSKDFKHRVKENFHNNIRNKGKDPYQPVFDEAAAYIVEKLNRKKAADLVQLQHISEIRFAASVSDANFAKYLKFSGGRAKLTAVPAADDPQLLRVQPMRVRNQLFIDQMQTHYADFDAELDASYLVWQEQSLLETKGARKAKGSSIARGVLGGLLVAVSAVASEENTDLANVASTAAAAGGALLLAQSFQQRAEMKHHRDAFAELGKSLDIELAPQVVEYEEQTVKLTGDAAQQHAQWIAFLREIYKLEETPGKQL